MIDKALEPNDIPASRAVFARKKTARDFLRPTSAPGAVGIVRIESGCVHGL